MDDLDHCPLCRSTHHRPFKTCRDRTASGRFFDLVECASCGFRFTNPRPSSDEIKRYYESEEYTPHQDTSRGLIDTLYRWVRLYTLRSKRRLVASLVDSPPGRLLDFGCGTGEFLAHCRSHGWAACGLEPDEKAQEVAAATHGLTVEPPEHIHDLPSNHFDVITLWHVLEHVPKLSDTIAELRRTLAPTGTLIVAVPNCASLDAHYYGADWAAYDVPRHLYHFRPPDVHRLFDQYGMTVTDIRPMRLDAFYVSLLSEQSRDGWLLRGPVVAALSVLWNAAHGHRSSAQLYLVRDESSR